MFKARLHKLTTLSRLTLINVQGEVTQTNFHFLSFHVQMSLQHYFTFSCSRAIPCDTIHLNESVQVSPYGVCRFLNLHQFLLDNVSSCNKMNHSMYFLILCMDIMKNTMEHCQCPWADITKPSILRHECETGLILQ